MILPIILAGGSGTRLWPLSRSNYPKQFLQLFGKHTMLQETALRVTSLKCAAPILVCNEEHRFIAAEQMRQINIKQSSIILEPFGRNTAPAIAIAAIKAIKAIKAMDGGDDPLLLVMPADHVIKDIPQFVKSVENATPLAEQGKLVTFGVNAQKPETNYGYIKRGACIQGANAFDVAKFVEKPDLTTAKSYLNSGDYYWNSGIYLFKASSFIDELRAQCPDVFTACEKAMTGQKSDMDFIRIDPVAFEASPNISIDYAVMENTKNAIIVPLDAEWRDLGSFPSLWEEASKDKYGNSFKGEVVSTDCENSFVISNEKLVATVGIKDLVVVDTRDTLLIAHKAKLDKTRKLLVEHANSTKSKMDRHKVTHRPWGQYDVLDSGDGFKVKRITVKAGGKLSLQKHEHRAEHWVVVSGIAKITKGEETFLLCENQSTYIPAGIVHSIENNGNELLELIEVQSGAYLSEDDIVRLDDIYGRI